MLRKSNDNNLVDSYSMIELLKQNMHENGYAVQVIPIERLNDLQKDIDNLRNSDLSSAVINTIANAFYRFVLPDAPFVINSIIIVASPKPLVKVNFNLKAKTISLLHHTYAAYKKSNTRQFLKEILNPEGYHVIGAASLPKKLLAVRSGLAKYGRNNITYVEGMGSLLGLESYYSDMPCIDNNWYEIQQMDLCKTCIACLNNCPTAAITKERYLIKAERCLTYLNEFVWPEVRDFPSWLDKSAHNCIHGCIKCQIHCPKNKEFLNKTIGPIEFNEEETLLLLEGRPITKIPEDTVIKLKKLNLADEYFSLIPRNLKVLLNQ